MPGYYPIFLNVSGRKCVVVGGGEVAERKVRGLVEAGSSVLVISPAVTEALGRLASEGVVEALSRQYRPGDIAEDAALVFAATDDPAVNHAAAQEAKEKGIPVNVADDPDYCDFILPSVLRRGDLVISVSTSGQSPALARRIREDLEGLFPEEYASLCGLLYDVRQNLHNRGKMVSSQQWHDAIDHELRDLLRRGRYEEAKEKLLSRLEVE
ncbi:MAG: bifunctional precorrin-2 dehydrogenase/sirohydrochlorin ferrochelatase [Chloroflexi bacterium]|nr:bifunctional precorrin-2 dehydrogenase/sirohydrochlorin ferrochelatase [Chloroflexota bacterium]